MDFFVLEFCDTIWVTVLFVLFCFPCFTPLDSGNSVFLCRIKLVALLEYVHIRGSLLMSLCLFISLGVLFLK